MAKRTYEQWLKKVRQEEVYALGFVPETLKAAIRKKEGLPGSDLPVGEGIPQRKLRRGVPQVV